MKSQYYKGPLKGLRRMSLLLSRLLRRSFLVQKQQNCLYRSGSGNNGDPLPLLLPPTSSCVQVLVVRAVGACYYGRTTEVQMQPFPPARRGGADSVLRNAFQCAPFLGVKASGGKYCCCVASVAVVYIAYRSHLTYSSSLSASSTRPFAQIDNATIHPRLDMSWLLRTTCV
jgi:hypothetical protein